MREHYYVNTRFGDFWDELIVSRETEDKSAPTICLYSQEDGFMERNAFRLDYYHINGQWLELEEPGNAWISLPDKDVISCHQLWDISVNDGTYPAGYHSDSNGITRFTSMPF